MNYKILKEFRKEKKLTLDYVSQKTGYTQSYISQIERGIKPPSLEALRRLSECLDIPIFVFFDDTIDNNSKNNGSYQIIKKQNRKKSTLPEVSDELELITPYQNDRKQIFSGYYYKMEPRNEMREMVTHSYNESIYILKGKIKTFVDEKEYELQEGDSIFIYRNTPHKFLNACTEEVHTVTYISYPK